MLQELINDLDHRGVLVIQAMLGKRCIELLEEEKLPKPKPKIKTTFLKPEGLITT